MSIDRCILFFPGSRPDRLPKALASSASCVCMDLEDAVPAEAKEDARRAALALLAEPDFDGSRLIVRINHPATDAGAKDLEELGVALAKRTRAGAPGEVSLMLPKPSGRSDVDFVCDALARHGASAPLIPIVETVRGLANVEELAGAESVDAILFGGLDLSVELGCALDWEALLYARSRTVHAARLADVGLIDMPFFDVADADGLRQESERARRLGFTAKAAIHPEQVDVIRAAFAPSEADVARARRVLEGSEETTEGAFLVDGVMMDRPSVEAARRIVSAAEGGED